jgi:predicted RNA binding protein YcfA (HicA-like mRNA interferase family)
MLRSKTLMSDCVGRERLEMRRASRRSRNVLLSLSVSLPCQWYNGVNGVPRKIRELIKDLRDAEFTQIPGGGKGSHRKFTHKSYSGAVTLSGQDGEDAKRYQEKQVKQAIEEVHQ